MIDRLLNHASSQPKADILVGKRWSCAQTSLIRKCTEAAIMIPVILLFFLASVEKFALPLITNGSIASPIISTSLMLAFFVWLISFFSETKPNERVAACVVLGVSFSALSTGLYITRLHPIEGWDVLDQWGRQAALLLSASLSNTAYSFDYIHPPTNYLIFALDIKIGMLSHFKGHFWGVSAFIFFCLGTTIARRSTGNVLIAAILSFAFSMLPLFQNHTLISGYADIWIALAIGMSLYFFEVDSQFHKRAYFLVFAIMPAYLKDSGFLISSSILLSAAGAIGLRKVAVGLPRVAVASVTIIMVVLVLSSNINVSIGDIKFYINWDYSAVGVGDRSALMAKNDPMKIIFALLWAFIVNQSYSVAFCFGLGIWGYYFTKVLIFETRGSVIFVFLLTTAILFYYAAAMWFSDYMYENSKPGSDTGLSRFSLYLWFPLLALFGFTIDQAQRRR